ncbi:MAG: HAD-IC family P-type ATPase [Bacilli bacterium]|nr:HAD-IC family P-type ATPase [Bacilli bacterium]
MSKRREELIADIKNVETIKKDPKVGLSFDEVQQRIKQGLTNKTPKKVTKSYWHILVDNIFSFFNMIYVVIAVLMMIGQLPFSNFLFIVPVVGNIVIGIFTDIAARRAVDKLKLITDPQVSVVRDGKVSRIPVDEIVLHDVVVYNAGDQIATDGVLLEGELSMDESLVTGESNKITKVVGDSVLSGTFAVSGKAYVRATMIGIANYAEGIQDEAKHFVRPKSEIKKATLTIFYLTGSVAIFIGLVMALIWLIQNNWNVTFESYQSFISSLSGSLVAMIPAGLYLLTSMTLTVGVLSLAKKHMNVQQLYCIEMLARVDTICFDKTGTLTDGKLAVSDFYNQSLFTDDELKGLVAGVVAATGDSNPTALAISNAFSKTKSNPIAFIPFDSEKKFSAASFENEGTIAIGAFGFLKADASVTLKARIDRLMSRGYRVLTVYWSNKKIVDKKVPTKFEAIGVIGISDNIKEDAKRNIEWFKGNGVDIKIISGDDPITVSEIAKRVGVDEYQKYISMQDVKDEDIPEIAAKYCVFGRVTPEQKSMLVKAMKAQGHKVAMTGDGVNDILALKSADCSIAMASGSSATRSSAHIISVDNDFSKLPDVVAEGRRVINNLQRTASLFLCKNFFAVGVSLIFIVSMLFGGPSYPFSTANMLIWETVAIGFGGFFLALQPASKRIRGSFLNQVLRKALPGGIMEVLSVVEVYTIRILAPEFISAQDAMNMSVVLFTSVALLSLILICRPFDIYRSSVLVGTSLAVAIVLYLDNGLIGADANGTTQILQLSLSTLSGTLWGITAMIFVAMAVIYILIDFLLKRVKEEKKRLGYEVEDDN